MSTSTYPIYDALPDDSDHLRLLTVHAGGVSEPIRCTLRTVSFRNKPSYEALSYTWGDSASTKPINVNNLTIEVTTNLEQALRHLRNAEQDLVLWVDAVCINQSDATEKSHQVAFMGKIYEQCAQVRIWLGCDSSRCSLTRSSSHASNAEDESHGAVDPFEIVYHLADDRHITEWPCFVTQSDSGQDTIVYETNDRFDIIIEAFKAVAESSWWSRMWTAQEAILPERGLLTYDIWSTSLQTITNFGANHYRHFSVCCRDAVQQFPSDYFTPLSNLTSITINLHGSRNMDGPSHVKRSNLRSKHITHGYRECKDPRDKVYGLLGIADDMSLKPDYTWDVHEVFMRTACHMIYHERGTLRSLIGFQYGPAPGKWASWVRQFDTSFSVLESAIAINREHIYDSAIFDASDGRESKGVLLVRQSQSETPRANQVGLKVEGTRVGTVSSVSQMTNNGKRERYTEFMLEALHWNGIDIAADYHACDNPSGEVGSYPDNFVRFWRTLLGGADIPQNSSIHPFHSTKFTTASMHRLDSFLSCVRDDVDFDPSLTGTIVVATYMRRCFKTSNSGYGLCYPSARVGDEVWVLNGSRVPFILRPTYLNQKEREALKPLDEQAFRMDGKFLFKDDHQPGNAPEGYYEFIGDCYLDGFMHGEAMQNDTFQEQTIVLV
ncbi:unnamed protein product [Alternaria burnsii]|nr:unnamed protein product [Alternaria burnsii]